MSKEKKQKSGYFGIGIYKGKTIHNIGTLWRSAYQLGADFVFTINDRLPKQSSDTLNTYKHIPHFHFENTQSFLNTIPVDASVSVIEFDQDVSTDLHDYAHSKSEIYILGSEDFGFDNEFWDGLQDRPVNKIEISSARTQSYNVAIAGSLVMYDRFIKIKSKEVSNE